GQLFWLSLRGRGIVWLGSYGALEIRELKAGEKATVDNFHLVAMDSTVGWSVRMFGGLKSAVLGGEGIVVDLTGPGRVYMQTRNPIALADYVYRYVRARTGSR
ncbi:MAG: AIM24 family protein, partial [Candidatus Korarchaeota archaeon NZ13-K]